MDLDQRRLAKPQHGVIGKIGLLDGAVLQGDFAEQGGGQTVNDAALYLRDDGVGIDDAPAIDDADHAVNLHGSLIQHGDFGDLGDDGAERFVQGDAFAAARPEIAAPLGFLRCAVEDGADMRFSLALSPQGESALRLTATLEDKKGALETQEETLYKLAIPPFRQHLMEAFARQLRAEMELQENPHRILIKLDIPNASA